MKYVLANVLDFVEAIQGKLISAVLVTLVNMSLTLSCKLVEVFFGNFCTYLCYFVTKANPDSVFSERELMFTFAICRRPSVCLSSVVCNVRAPYSGY